MQVQTTKGLIALDKLVVKDIINLYDNVRTTATEWYYNDELVRRDVHANVLNGLSLNPEQNQL